MFSDVKTALGHLEEYYDDILNKKSDPRVSGWPLMDSPGTMLIIGIVYYHFVKISGPKFMANRKPYNLKTLMVYYNTIQVSVNGFAVYQGVKALMHPDYNLLCSPVTYNTSKYEMKLTYLSWLYFFVKVVDLLDTVFMVLRKNFHQVSFLHVYHHLGMALGSWVIVKYIPGGHLCVVGVINCFIHTIMYFYYLLTAYDPEVKKSIWWKKHITELQMVQFGLILIHHFIALVNPNCNYPKFPLLIFISQNFLMCYLFAKFYYENYIKNKKIKVD